MNCRGNVVLLVTGCMRPSSEVPFLTLNNADEREAQTVDALSFFLEQSSFSKIVYCDNSNPPENKELVQLAEANGKQLEWIGFTGKRDKVIEKGKGYGEGEIIQYAMEHSELINDDTYLVKITARVKIRNINLLTFAMRKRRLHFAVIDWNGECDTLFYGMPVSVYKSFFLTAHEKVDDKKGWYLEKEFNKILLSSETHLLKRETPFLVYPQKDGISGTSGGRYNLLREGWTWYNKLMYATRYCPKLTRWWFSRKS